MVYVKCTQCGHCCFWSNPSHLGKHRIWNIRRSSCSIRYWPLYKRIQCTPSHETKTYTHYGAKGTMIPYSSRYTALCLIGLMVFGFLTLDGTMHLGLGISSMIIFTIMLIASMTSLLPEETELSIHEEMTKSELLKQRR